jgi:hypothetical protein
VYRILTRAAEWLNSAFDPPSIKPHLDASIDLQRERRETAAKQKFLEQRVSELQAGSHRAAYIERAMELIEARQMAGVGPWLVAEAREKIDSPKPGELMRAVRESNPLISQGAYGDIELALQNVEWRREVNLSWLEFSRWGIQQIILICRLYFIKNPITRRLTDICAYYVFGRGVEVSSPDPDENDVLEEFLKRNKSVLGQTALMDLERRKYYDGNIFFVLFADKQDTGKVSIRTIDAVEVMDIITDPDDTDTPWLYRRSWTQRAFDIRDGLVHVEAREAWYPALNWEPAAEMKASQMINGVPIMWDCPVLHRKSGAVAKWHFGCPVLYPALDWAKSAKEFLEACATTRKALAQVAMTFTTKGGQQALEGIKTQLGTTVGPNSSLWDTNPPPVDASIFASGPGSTLAAFKTQGAGGDPEQVRRYLHQCCMVVGVPETFLADVSTGNLATATTLDRPTELKFSADQECWVEDITTICTFVLSVSSGAASGKLREARAKSGKKDAPTVNVTFPAIREGDTPAIVAAIVNAMTLGNKMGEVFGIDEKAGVLQLLKTLEIEDAEQILEEMYPDKGPDAYDPNRTKEPPEPIAPTADPNAPQPTPTPAPAAKKPAKKAIKEAAARLTRALKLMEAEGGE